MDWLKISIGIAFCQFNQLKISYDPLIIFVFAKTICTILQKKLSAFHSQWWLTTVFLPTIPWSSLIFPLNLSWLFNTRFHDNDDKTYNTQWQQQQQLVGLPNALKSKRRSQRILCNKTSNYNIGCITAWAATLQEIKLFLMISVFDDLLGMELCRSGLFFAILTKQHGTFFWLCCICLRFSSIFFLVFLCSYFFILPYCGQHIGC